MTATALISVRDVRKAFGSSLVLDRVSLDVHAGEMLALLGPNGAGKTTLLKIVATLTRPTRGSVLVGGHDTVRAPERVRAVIGVVAHGSYLYEDLTASENLQFWTAFAGVRASAAMVRAALAEVELDHCADDRVRTFSAGMKRRLALARLALGRPQVLLLDEPFAGLDTRAKKWLEARLEAFTAAGGATLLVTHSFGHELGIAQRIAILAGGRIAFDTPRAALVLEDLPRLYAVHAEEPG